MKPSNTGSPFGRIFTFTLICAAAALMATPSAALAGCVAPPSGLVSWWRAEGNANDGFGTNHGTLVNGLTFTNGEAGQAFNFDGVDDYVLVASDPGLNFTPNQDFSIEAWVQPLPSVTTFDVMTIVDKRNAPNISQGIGYELALVGGRLEFRISDSLADVGTSFGPGGPDLRDGQFHHVAVTISRNATNGGRYYVDGAMVLTFDPTVEPGDLSNDQPLRIGQHATPSVFANFKGRMDEVSIYQRALSVDEVQAIYNGGTAGKCAGATPPPCVAAPSGLVSWWRAEGNGYDSLGANHGTLLNGLSFTNGEAGQAFNFDGVDDYLRVANDPSLNFVSNQDFSMEAWIQPEVSATTFDVMTIIDKRNAPDTLRGLGYSFALVSGRLECRISDSIADGGTSFGAAGPDLRDGKFHHVAVTILRNSTNGGHYYVDGAAVLTFDPTVEAGDLSNDQPLRIGQHATPGVFANFRGRMDEVSIYKRALSAGEVQAIHYAGSAGKCAGASPPNCVAAPSGLVSWWAAEGNAGDSIGNLSGSLFGGTTFASGKVGQAFSFDGLNDAVINTMSGLTNILDSYTMELWAWPTAGRASTPEGTSGVDGHGNQRYAVFPHVGPTGGTVGAGISVGTNGVSVFEAGDTYLPALLVFDAPIVGWTHIAVVYTNRRPSLYLNGVLVRSGLTSVNHSCPSTWLGERGPTSANQGWYAGLLDEFAIYNRSLSAAEIQAIYNAGGSGKCVVAPSPSIASQPADQAVAVGDTATFNVSASGAPPLNYQWRLNTTNIVGATAASLVLTNVQLAAAGTYSVVISNSVGTVTSSNATLTVNALSSCVSPPSGLVGWWAGNGNANDIAGNNNGSFANPSFSTGEVSQAFSFDGVSNYVRIPASATLDVGVGNGMTVEAWIKPADLAQRPIVEWAVNGAYAVLLWANTLNPGSLYAGIFGTDGGSHIIQSAGGILQANAFQHVAVTYDKASGISRLLVNGAIVAESNFGTFTPRTDSDVYIGYRPSGSPTGPVSFLGQIDEVSIYDRALGASALQQIYAAGSAGKCDSPIPPYINTQPTNQATQVGGNATFSVGAGGTPALAYQWRLNGTNIGGATASSLVLTNAQLTNAGIYSVTVSNAAGLATSSNATLTVSAAPPCVAPSLGLVSWWSGNGNANDLVGGNNGIFSNGAAFAAGKVGQGFSFLGGSNNVRIPASPSLDVGKSNGLTIEAWINPADLGQHPIVEWVPGGAYGVLVWISVLSPGSVYADLFDSNGGEHLFQSPAGVIVPNAFQHLAVTYDQATGLGKIFVNGVLVRESVLGNFTPLTSSDLYIGYRPAGTPGGPIPFSGIIDEVSLYSRALSLAEVQGIYNAGSAGKCVPTNPPPCAGTPSGLVSWWRGAGNTFDEIGGNHGTLAGDATYGVGRVGQGYVFDGIGDVVQLGNPTNLQAQNFTIEAWIKRAATNRVSLNGNGNGTIFGHDIGGFGLYLDPTGRPALTKVGVDNRTLTTRIADTNFHHLAVTKTNTTIRFYIDGVAYSVASYNPGFVFTKAAYIGGIGTNFTFLGSIDDLAFYNRALTTNEVRAIYNAGSAGKCVSTTAPVIVAQPVSQSAILGDTVTLAVTATGTPPLSYQWQFNGTNLGGATLNTLLLTNVQFADSGSYSVVVSNSVGTTNSSSATLTVNPPPPCTPSPAGVISWWRAEGNGDDTVGNNAGTLIGGLIFTNGEVHQAFSFDGVDDYVLVSNAPSLNFGAGQDFSVEAWIQPQASSTTFDVMTIVDKRNAPDISSGIGYEVAVVGGRLECRISDSLAGGGTTFGSAGPDLRDGRFHHVAVTMVRNSTTGGRYYVDGVEVLTFNPTVEPGDLSNDQPLQIGRHATPSVNGQFKGRMDEVSIYNRALSATEVQAIYHAGGSGKCVTPTPPAIVSQPADQTVILGDPATFAVTANGTPPLSYQWQFNGTNILDATNSAFTLAGVQFADAGNYAVLVSNLTGSVLSSNAALTVNPPPPCAPLPVGLVSWWRAETNAADAVATNAGTLLGGLAFTNGQVGQAFSLDGVDDYVEVADAPSLNFGANQDFSIEAWIQPQVSSTTFDVMSIVEKRNAPDISHGIGYELAVVGGRLECRISDSITDVGTSFGAAGPDLRDGHFHHVAVTFTRNSTNGGHYYVDGVAVLTFDPTVEPGDLSNDQPLRIGSHPTPDVFGQFKGRIDELSIYNRALSTNEIRGIYDAGKSGKCVPPPLPDLALTLSAAPDSLSLGQRLTYTLHLTNSGLATATNVVVTDSLPEGVAFVSAGNGGSFSNGVVTFRLDTFASGASADLTVVVLTTVPGVVTNTVTVGSDTSETSSANNSASVPVTVLFQSSPGLLVAVASPMTLNRQTGLMEQRIRLTNQGTNTLFAARVFLCGLPTNSVYNASGFANGCPFVQYNLPLAPGASVDFLMEYYLRRAVPDPSLVAVEVPLTEPVGVPGMPFNIDRSVKLADGRFLIEFTTTPGRVYTIQYSNGADDPFKTAVPSITAPANRLQWLDDGPPKTESKPTGTSRFYRVFETTAP